MEHLKAGYAQIVAEWCLEFFEQFKKAPQHHIQDIYKQRRKQLRDEDDAELLGDFLRELSKRWEKINTTNIDFALTNATVYLKGRQIELAIENTQEALDEGDIPRAEAVIGGFSRVEKATGQGTSLIWDPERVKMAFSEDAEPLVTLPKAVGEVAGIMRRTDFFGILAPMKRGKTWWMWYVAETALYAGLKVVFVTLEMPETQMVRRAWQSLNGMPQSTQQLRIPKFYRADGDDEGLWELIHEEVERDGVDVSKIPDRSVMFQRRFRTGDVRVVSFPSARVSDINSMLDNLHHYEDWVPDVVVVDYADIMSPESQFKGDYRHGLDDIWKGLRRMAKERNCLVVTASQSDRTTFAKDAKQDNVAEDIRKLAHVTHMIALNQTEIEAERGVMRVSQLAVREGRKTFQQAVVLQCLDIGRVCLDSRLRGDVMDDVVDESGQNRGRRSGR
jgi:hypothetical protein